MREMKKEISILGNKKITLSKVKLVCSPVTEDSPKLVSQHLNSEHDYYVKNCAYCLLVIAKTRVFFSSGIDRINVIHY